MGVHFGLRCDKEHLLIAASLPEKRMTTIFVADRSPHFETGLPLEHSFSNPNPATSIHVLHSTCCCGRLDFCAGTGRSRRASRVGWRKLRNLRRLELM
eukprot:m.185376 g.185376  ORF g.185376 m.185376 type:complete len:98 (-) comp32232_c0_seq3:33-326(-)